LGVFLESLESFQMTDTTTTQTAGPVTDPLSAAVVAPTIESVRDKASALLVEIDNSQAHTEVSQFLIDARAHVVAALSWIESHFTAFEAKVEAAAKVVEAEIMPSTSTAAPADVAAEAAPAAAPATPASAAQ
jgi:hypothetical protein